MRGPAAPYGLLETIVFYLGYLFFPNRCHYCWVSDSFTQTYSDYLDGRSILCEEEYTCDHCDRVVFFYSYGAVSPTLEYCSSWSTRLTEILLISMGVI